MNSKTFFRLIGIAAVCAVVSIFAVSCATGGGGSGGGGGSSGSGGGGGTAAPAQTSAPAAHPLDGTIEKSFGLLTANLKNNARIALMPVASKDPGDGGYVYDTLTVQFVNSMRYDMVERAQIEALLKEQDFQMSGLVDDKTAVGFGEFLGAEIIIVGAIQGEGATKRLVFRALDVRTAKIQAMVSERI